MIDLTRGIMWVEICKGIELEAFWFWFGIGVCYDDVDSSIVYVPRGKVSIVPTC